MSDSLDQAVVTNIVATFVVVVSKRLTITATNALLNPSIVAPENAYTIEDQ